MVSAKIKGTIRYLVVGGGSPRMELTVTGKIAPFKIIFEKDTAELTHDLQRQLGRAFDILFQRRFQGVPIEITIG